MENSFYNYPLLIKQLLISPLSSNPEQEIVDNENQRYDYKRLNTNIHTLANALRELGIKKGDTIGVMAWDTIRYLEFFFTIPMMGAILHTINIRLSEQQILYTINHADDDILIVHYDFIQVIDKIRKKISRPIKIILLNSNKYNLSDNNTYLYKDLIKNKKLKFKFEDFDENTTATKFYTTGTTGDPKGVSYSHRQLVIHTLGFIAGSSVSNYSHRLHNEDVYMPLTPMFHVHGWGFPYMATLLGVKQVYPGRYEPKKLLDLIKQEKVTFSHCVPTILQMLLNENKKLNYDLSKLKLIIGGSAMSKSLAEEAQSQGINVVSAYGMSETCPFLTIAQMPSEDRISSQKELIKMRTKTGKPGPLVDLRIVDENFKDVIRDNNSTGEIVVRAPWLTNGYIKDEKASKELWKGGYLHTGDVGYIDDTGSLIITDRIKDIIKSGGEWISSLQIEDIVSKCKGVKEVAAIGIKDVKWGERPIIIVTKIVTENAEDITKRIKERISNEIKKGLLSKWAMPDKIEYVKEIEKTSVGKVNKKLLREKYKFIKTNE
ncbi:fatty acid--CoA ligase [SAR116 cluster bacterium]|nr:fatty acid--CoA ligase [SAR116 cluster bacterium]